MAGPGRFALVLLTTLAAAAVLLRLVDSVPAWLRGEPRALREYASLDALEADLRTRVLLPSYFPDSLQWPPARVALAPGDGHPVLVEFADQRTGATALVVCQTIRGDFPIPPRLLRPGRVLTRQTVFVRDRPARVTRSLGPRGEAWSDVAWVVQDRRVVMRVIGPDDHLMRLARSLHRSRP